MWTPIFPENSDSPTRWTALGSEVVGLYGLAMPVPLRIAPR